MAPEPLADIVTALPWILPPKEIAPPFAVDVNDKAPDEVNAVVVLIDLLLVTDRLAKVEPPDARIMALVVEFTTVAVPVVLMVKFGVTVLILPILPEPDASEIEVLPVSVPND
jgi:hypothetical protein